MLQTEAAASFRITFLLLFLLLNSVVVAVADVEEGLWDEVVVEQITRRLPNRYIMVKVKR
jgi:hypothetical protein